MFFLDVANIFTLILLLIATVLLIFLSQELKKSYISGIALFFYLILLYFYRCIKSIDCSILFLSFFP